MILIDIINNYHLTLVPKDTIIFNWIKYVLYDLKISKAHLSLILVNKYHMQEFNSKFRYINKVTNVLSFPNKNILSKNYYLGDIILCPKLILEESRKYNKKLSEHWCHMIIHGVLHILGYEHYNNKSEKIMKNKEISILKNFNMSNPYIKNI